GKKALTSATTKDYLNKFWELIDEVLNAILFLFIGFELLIIPDIVAHWVLGLFSILVVLVARLLSIWIPSVTVHLKKRFSRGTLTVLVWGGVRGGVSIALALSVPAGEFKDVLLEITYFVVVFSIVFQGLTVGKLANKVLPNTPDLG